MSTRSQRQPNIAHTLKEVVPFFLHGEILRYMVRLFTLLAGAETTVTLVLITLTFSADTPNTTLG
jgi:hypothetical protein